MRIANIVAGLNMRIADIVEGLNMRIRSRYY
jgi:hypothetical protein